MKTVLILAIAFTLASCGPEQKSTGSAASSGNHDAGGPISEARLGLKIYPGSRIVTSGETDEVVSANLVTSDSSTKVIEFYEQELGIKAEAGTAMISAKKNGRAFVVSLAKSGGGTAISIMGKK